MSSIFELIREEFISDLDAIRILVASLGGSGETPRVRLAAANSATLLVAATFEEYIRQSAREYARLVVSNARSFADVPNKLYATAWRRSLERLAKISFDIEDQTARSARILTARSAFIEVQEFVCGDLTRDVFSDLIHNENNMRPHEINSMFKIAGLRDVCAKLCEMDPIKDYFGESENGKAHGKFVSAIGEFMERRNGIAHALNSGSSTGVDQILRDIDMFVALATSLSLVLDMQISVVTPTHSLAPVD